MSRYNILPMGDHALAPEHKLVLVDDGENPMTTFAIGHTADPQGREPSSRTVLPFFADRSGYSQLIGDRPAVVTAATASYTFVGFTINEAKAPAEARDASGKSIVAMPRYHAAVLPGGSSEWCELPEPPKERVGGSVATAVIERTIKEGDTERTILLVFGYWIEATRVHWNRRTCMWSNETGSWIWYSLLREGGIGDSLTISAAHPEQRVAGHAERKNGSEVGVVYHFNPSWSEEGFSAKPVRYGRERARGLQVPSLTRLPDGRWIYAATRRVYRGNNITDPLAFFWLQNEGELEVIDLTFDPQNPQSAHGSEAFSVAPAGVDPSAPRGVIARIAGSYFEGNSPSACLFNVHEDGSTTICNLREAAPDFNAARPRKAEGYSALGTVLVRAEDGNAERAFLLVPGSR